MLNKYQNTIKLFAGTGLDRSRRQIRINDLTPNDFVKGLKTLERQRDERIYGAVHGFHGVKIKKKLRKEAEDLQEFSEIQFLRFHLFYAYLWSRLSKGNLPEDYVGPTEKLFHKNLDNNMIQEFEILKKHLTKKIRTYLQPYLIL